MANLLIIDDKNLRLPWLESTLESTGHNLIDFQLQDELITTIEGRSIDLLVVDLRSKAIERILTLTMIKDYRGDRVIPSIVIVRKSDDMLLDDAIKAGASDCIVLPSNPVEIKGRIESQLKLKELSDKLIELKALFDDELKIAQDTQKSILPISFPYKDKVLIATRYKPTGSVGGDFYDVIKYEDNKIGILVADVSGHGPSAAMGVSVLKTISASYLQKYPSDLIATLNKFNEIFMKASPKDQYVTMFLGIVDLDSKTIHYVRAGHPYPLILRSSNEATASVERLEGIGEFIGIFEDFDIEEEKISFAKDDRLLIYSDGIIETADKNDQLYGIERLENLIIRCRNHNNESLLDEIISDIEIFHNNAAFYDDIALILLEFL